MCENSHFSRTDRGSRWIAHLPWLFVFNLELVWGAPPPPQLRHCVGFKYFTKNILSFQFSCSSFSCSIPYVCLCPSLRLKTLSQYRWTSRPHFSTDPLKRRSSWSNRKVSLLWTMKTRCAVYTSAFTASSRHPASGRSLHQIHQATGLQSERGRSTPLQPHHRNREDVSNHLGR